MITERELKEINRHCVCGKPNFLFVKWYKWRENREKWMRCAGTFKFCNDPKCLYYFKNFLTLDEIHTDLISQDECYFTATGYTLDNLPAIW